MIEIKDVKGLNDEKENSVLIPYSEYLDLLECRIKGLKLYGKLKQMVTDRYVENYACFGNGGTITYTELAMLFNIELPPVAHVGVTEWLKIKGKEFGNERKDG